MSLWLDKIFKIDSKLMIKILELIDKKETLSFELDFEKSKHYNSNFNSPKIEKSKRIQDFDGEIKIELDYSSWENWRWNQIVEVLKPCPLTLSNNAPETSVIEVYYW